MTNDESSSNDETKSGRTFDLEERTAQFGEAVIKLCKRLPINPITAPLINQVVKAASSVGANYVEANDAESRKDFRHKIGICRKESKESKHFLRLIVAAAPEARDECAILWQEAKELNLIFGKIWRSSD